MKKNISNNNTKIIRPPQSRSRVTAPPRRGARTSESTGHPPGGDCRSKTDWGGQILEIKGLTVAAGESVLLQNVSLNVKPGDRVLLRGRNGGGKSTLVSAIAGNSEYKITSGKIIFDGKDITYTTMDERARMGIFTASQNVPEIPGLSVMSFLKHSISALRGGDVRMGELLAEINDAREKLDIPETWLARSINVGFSGGERKRLAFMRLILSKPKLAILDEPDSGADTVAQKLFADTILNMPDTAFLIISHQQKFIEMIKPTKIVDIDNL